MENLKHLGAYGLIIDDGKVLLIKKHGGPYDGKLDLPGGTIEFGETPGEALKREFLEEVGIIVNKYELLDIVSVVVKWPLKEKIVKVHHLGIFYQVVKYKNDIKREVKIDEVNDDSLGAEFYDIKSLAKNNLSAISLLALNKLSYKIK